ncbi:flagellar hook-associated family protein [Lichenifustis flavocetrariae]|uniref:Flagellin n=1 Tax=Lichenifustis flavocetrariae TaxID=2949735 RepID=A0AA41YUT3_9HYPH|nr:flagellar hook-associated family protein [Lichenifustis flavocetrariae]MCW6508529.1 flagellar hook-associated family protein [Lichenifustis flavocetrariae]
MVYVSSSSITMASRQGVMQIQNQLSDAQTELSSGVHADVGLKLGSLSSQLVSLQQQQANLTTYQTNNTLAATRLSTTTTALDSIRTNASSFLAALTTASSDGGFTSTLQQNAISSLTALTGALNTSVSGEYIFAGINTAVQPVTTYVQSPASANKAAIDTAFSGAFGFSQTSANANGISSTAMQSFLDGSFASLFSTTGYSTSWSSASDTPLANEIYPNQTIATSVSANAAPFRQLAQAYSMITEFGGTNFGSGASQAALSSAVTLVNSALSGLTSMEAGVGISQNAVTSANTAMSAQSDIITTQIDSMAGVDQNDLATKLSQLQTQLNASYSVTAQLQKLSLVNYLS